jgi:transglutaminase-like putative cysteine protease
LVNLHGYAYYYHAWCAVWLGKWVPVDPTLNQFPADVGHLKLKEGEISEQAMVLKVVGKLNINTLDYK